MDASTAPDRAAYTYTPLEKGQVRLIDLQPALDTKAPLCISIRKGRLLDLEAQYEAISYTWGEPRLAYPLYVEDGTRILVTENLDHTLRRVRLPTSNRTLWADAICINQNDKDEKALQIPLMTFIFRRASTVLAWLGEGLEEEKGLKLLNSTSRTWTSAPVIRSPDFEELEGNPVENHIQSVRDFLSLAWFSRLWVIQEVVFNTDVILFCGTSEITWVRFVTALGVLQKAFVGVMSSGDSQRIEVLQVIGRLWKRHAMGDEAGTYGDYGLTTSEKILKLVNEFGLYECTDARDRIFAVCSMASDVRTTHEADDIDSMYVHLNIDYAADILQTYQRFAVACIDSGQASAILDAVLSRQYTSGTEDWPSWVPDWRKPSVALDLTVDHPIDCMVHSSTKLVVSIGSEWCFHSMVLPTVTSRFPTGDTLESFSSSLYEICAACELLVASDLLMSLLPDDTWEWDGRTAISFVQRVLNHLDPHLESSSNSRNGEHLDKMHRMRKAMKDQCFFTATAPNVGRELGVKAQCGGYGNAAMRTGDQFATTGYHLRPHHNFGCVALLLRPLANAVGDHHTPYRLIGSAYVRSPWQGRPYRTAHGDPFQVHLE